MSIFRTAAALSQTSAWTPPPYSDLVTKIGAKDPYSYHADLAALIGGIVSAVLLVMICMIAVLMWCLSRQKGSYETNEMDEDGDEDDESASSDVALQSKEPLKSKEED
ncbi:glycophorin-C [Pholidichthys leucotaenia]